MRYVRTSIGISYFLAKVEVLGIGMHVHVRTSVYDDHFHFCYPFMNFQEVDIDPLFVSITAPILQSFEYF